MKDGFLYPITFLRSDDIDKVREFYGKTLGLPLALDQKSCIVFRIGRQGYWGFCEADRKLLPVNPETVCLTLVVGERREVDRWHKRLVKAEAVITQPPQYNEQYRIYNLFSVDPHGYTLEIQAFEDDAKPEGAP